MPLYYESFQEPRAVVTLRLSKVEDTAYLHEGKIVHVMGGTILWAHALCLSFKFAPRGLFFKEIKRAIEDIEAHI